MKTRKVYLIKDSAFTGAQILTQDINIKDPIQSFDVLIRMTNGAGMTEASTVKIHDEFTNFELADGADVLVSASMEELQGLHVLDNTSLPDMHMTLEDDAVQREGFRISFGLDDVDMKHYLDPSRYYNLQLKITNTFTAAAATTWAAAGHTITVIANVIDEGAEANEGFLSPKSIYAFTAVDGAEVVIEMPRDMDYRAVMIQSMVTGSRPDQTLEVVKLTCDADKYVPINVDTDDLMSQNIALLGGFTERLDKRITGAGTICTDLFYDTHGIVTQDTSVSHPGLVTTDADVISVEIDVGTAGVDANSAVEGLVSASISGYSLHSCMYLPFGKLDNPSSWFKAAEYGNIKLKLTGEASAGAVRVLTQQLRMV